MNISRKRGVPIIIIFVYAACFAVGGAVGKPFPMNSLIMLIGYGAFILGNFNKMSDAVKDRELAAKKLTEPQFITAIIMAAVPVLNWVGEVFFQKSIELSGETVNILVAAISVVIAGLQGKAADGTVLKENRPDFSEVYDGHIEDN
jgi:hypothetical protein